jgi:hypothetical protein
MKKFLKIKLLKENQVFGVAQELSLEPFSTNSGRKFFFKKIAVKESFKIEYSDTFTVQVFCRRKHLRNKQCLFEFSITVLDLSDDVIHTHTDWWVYGFIHHPDLEEYKQGVVDIVCLWQQHQDVHWKELPVGSPLKRDYISACFFYSSLPNAMLDKTVYPVDLGFAKEEVDFLYLLSVALLGEKSYLGHSLFTFDDCILELFHRYGYFSQKKILFYHVKDLNEATFFIYEDIKKILLKYQFKIEENS